MDTQQEKAPPHEQTPSGASTSSTAAHVSISTGVQSSTSTNANANTNTNTNVNSSAPNQPPETATSENEFLSSQQVSTSAGRNTPQPSSSSSRSKKAENNVLKHAEVKFRTKRISWFNPVFQSQMTSEVLIQNENGPCALIAVVNTLILNYQLKHNYLLNNSGPRSTDPAKCSEIEQLVKLVDTKDVVKFTDIIDLLGSILLVNVSSKVSQDNSNESKGSILTVAEKASNDTSDNKSAIKHLPNAALQVLSKETSLENDSITGVLNLLSHLHEGLNINPNFTTGRIDNSVTDVDFSLAEIFDKLAPDIENPQSAPKESLLSGRNVHTFQHRAPPSLKNSPELSLFKLFDLSIYHGWLADPTLDFEEFKIINYLQNFDVCQNFLIYVDDLLENKRGSKLKGKEAILDDGSEANEIGGDCNSKPELDFDIYRNLADDNSSTTTGHNPFEENDMSNNGVFLMQNLTPAEQDILYAYRKNINNWLARSSTQLTEKGINTLKDQVESDSFVIFFRNDHFSTLFKRTVYNEANEKDFELYSLVTDEGFVNLRNVVWQELKSVNGFDELFYDRNFIPVDLNNQATAAAAAAVSKNEPSGSPGMSTPADVAPTNLKSNGKSSSSASAKPQSGFAADLYKTSDFYSPNLASYDGLVNGNDDEDFRLAQQLQEKEDAAVAKRLQKNLNSYGNNGGHRTAPGGGGTGKAGNGTIGNDKNGSAANSTKLKKDAKGNDKNLAKKHKDCVIV